MKIKKALGFFANAMYKLKLNEKIKISYKISLWKIFIRTVILYIAPGFIRSNTELLVLNKIYCQSRKVTLGLKKKETLTHILECIEFIDLKANLAYTLI